MNSNLAICFKQDTPCLHYNCWSHKPYEDLTLFYSGYLQTGTLANSEDPDESALFAKMKTISGSDIHHNLENSTCDPNKKKSNSILILSTCMGKSIRIKKVKKSAFREKQVSISHHPNLM